MRELAPRARTLVVLTLLAAALAVTSAATRGDVDSWGDLAGFALLFVLATSFSTTTNKNMAVGVGYIVGLASILVLGWAGAVLVGPAAVLGYWRIGHIGFVKPLYNAAMFTLCAAVAGGMATAIIGSSRVDTVSMGRLLLASAVATVAYFVVNNVLLVAIISLSSGMPFLRVWTSHVSWLTGTQLGYGLLGVLFAELYIELGPVSGVFFLVPLLVARSAFANYAQQREAYDSTVRAFAQAVETKDFYTRGHSERVSRVAEMIAREHGMREDRVQVIRIAGMLHDVGKLGVPTRVLQKQGKLNELEFEAIKLHPLRGYEMLCEIEFLHEALDGVYHHHERMDGRGYPMGLTGEEIPEFARIVMVADAFDSMTSTRSYRQAKSVDEAITELRRCEQVQFDAHMVDCLVRAIGKHGWEPHAEDYHGEQVSRETLVMRPQQGASSFEQAEQRRG